MLNFLSGMQCSLIHMRVQQQWTSVASADRDTDGGTSLIGENVTAAEPGKRDRTRVLLFGMECGFTAPIAEVLRTDPAVSIAAIVLASTEPEVRTSESSWKSPLATNKRVPIIELANRSELRSVEFLATLAAFEADLIFVACFPWRLPKAVLDMPRIASINVHPSLLPDGRGPEPIFWAFRRDLEKTGVTLHVIDDGLDTGPIIAQRLVAIPAEATMLTLEQTLARIGAEMLSEFLTDPSITISAWRQPSGSGHSDPFPDADDLLVTTAWKATTAARFINAARPVYGYIEVLVLASGQRLAVEEVLEIKPLTSTAAPVVLQGDQASIKFSDGLLHCRLRSESQKLAFGL